MQEINYNLLVYLILRQTNQLVQHMMMLINLFFQLSRQSNQLVKPLIIQGQTEKSQEPRNWYLKDFLKQEDTSTGLVFLPKSAPSSCLLRLVCTLALIVLIISYFCIFIHVLIVSFQFIPLFYMDYMYFPCIDGVSFTARLSHLSYPLRVSKMQITGCEGLRRSPQERPPAGNSSSSLSAWSSWTTSSETQTVAMTTGSSSTISLSWMTREMER